MNKASEEIKNGIMDILSILASLEDQKKFASRVEYNSYHDEFYSWWFDEFDANGPVEKVIFNTNQISILKEFSGLLEIQSSKLPVECSIEALHDNQEWRVVVEAAKQALVSLRLAT